MTFSPDKPENPTDLVCHCDPEKDQSYVLIYSCDEGDFYRHKGEWNEIDPNADWEFDFDGLIVVYVGPAFIPVYDKAEADNVALPIEEVVKYESVSPETE